MKKRQHNDFSVQPLEKKAAGKALYMQLITDLRQRILDGSLEIGARLPSELELSEKYGISRGTVRQATNVLVNEGLVERLHGSGTFVRRWQNNESEPTAGRRIGLVMVNVAGELSMNIMNGVQQAAKARGYQLSVTSTIESKDQHAEQANDIQRLRADDTAGLIIFPVSDIEYDETIAELQQAGIPVVLVDRYLSNLNTDYVVADNFMGGYRATEHLIILGHKRISFVYDETEASLSTTSVRDRWMGYRKALEEYGLEYEETLLFQRPNAPSNEAQRIFKGFMSGENRPTAFFAVKDLIAVDLMQLAQRSGFRIPDDIALVGFDNLNLTGYLNPALTTVEQSGLEMGLRAGNLLIDRIEGFDGPYQHIKWMVHLIIRESCGARLHVRKQSLARTPLNDSD